MSVQHKQQGREPGRFKMRPKPKPPVPKTARVIVGTTLPNGDGYRTYANAQEDPDKYAERVARYEAQLRDWECWVCGHRKQIVRHIKEEIQIRRDVADRDIASLKQLLREFEHDEQEADHL